MARRDRYRDRVWLRKLPDDPSDGNLVAPAKPLAPMSFLVSELTGKLSLWLEVEKDLGIYHMRCYPRVPAEGALTPQICASYSGHHLLALMAQALCDYTAYQERPTGAQISRIEHVRWVP